MLCDLENCTTSLNLTSTDALENKSDDSENKYSVLTYILLAIPLYFLAFCCIGILRCFKYCIFHTWKQSRFYHPKPVKVNVEDPEPELVNYTKFALKQDNIDHLRKQISQRNMGDGQIIFGNYADE